MHDLLMWEDKANANRPSNELSSRAMMKDFENMTVIMRSVDPGFFSLHAAKAQVNKKAS